MAEVCSTSKILTDDCAYRDLQTEETCVHPRSPISSSSAGVRAYSMSALKAIPGLMQCCRHQQNLVDSRTFQRGFLIKYSRRGMQQNTMKLQAAQDGKTVLVPVADGSEEMEAVIIIDVLRRAGAYVTVASIEESLVVDCSRGVKIQADVFIADCATQSYDLIALPGGMPGAERLRDCSTLSGLLERQTSSSKHLAAICASPAVVLEPKGYLKGKKATSHPAFVDGLTDKTSAEDRVVVDGTVTTSRGPGTSFEFALSLVRQLYGMETMNSVAAPMVMHKIDD